MTEAEQVIDKLRSGIKFLGLGGSMSINGRTYQVSSFRDGSAIFVSHGKALDFSNEPVIYEVLDTWAHAGQCIELHGKGGIAKILREKYDAKPGDVICISSVKWNWDGTYAGTSWRQPCIKNQATTE